MSDQEPHAVRVRLSVDPERPIELALHFGRGFDEEWACFRLTHRQGRHVVLALQAVLVHILPGQVIHRDGSSGDPPTMPQGGTP